MSRSTLRLALLMVIAVILVAACNGAGGLPLRPDMATYDFQHMLDNPRTATFTNQTDAQITAASSAIIGMFGNGFLGVGTETCGPRTIAPRGMAGDECRTTIRLTSDPGNSGYLTIVNARSTELGLATLRH